jgi:hypothetical protein
MFVIILSTLEITNCGYPEGLSTELYVTRNQGNEVCAFGSWADAAEYARSICFGIEDKYPRAGMFAR